MTANREYLATFYTDAEPANGSRPWANGHGCIRYTDTQTETNCTRSGVYTLEGLRKACRCPIVGIWDVSCSDLLTALDLPQHAQKDYLLAHGGELIRA